MALRTSLLCNISAWALRAINLRIFSHYYGGFLSRLSSLPDILTAVCGGIHSTIGRHNNGTYVGRAASNDLLVFDKPVPFPSRPVFEKEEAGRHTSFAVYYFNLGESSCWVFPWPSRGRTLHYWRIAGNPAKRTLEIRHIKPA